MVESILFYLFAGLAVASGVGILFSTHIVRMAYLLIGMLLAVSGIYFLLGNYFLGVIQIIVYAGGVAVLVVFGVMLTSRALAPRMVPRRWEVAWLAVTATGLLTGLALVLLNARWASELRVEANRVVDFGYSLLGKFLGPFELASVLLLVALLGAAYLARPRVPTPGVRGGAEGGNQEQPSTGRTAA